MLVSQQPVEPLALKTYTTASSCQSPSYSICVAPRLNIGKRGHRLGISSVLECLPTMHKTLGSIPSTAKSVCVDFQEHFNMGERSLVPSLEISIKELLEYLKPKENHVLFFFN